ncbi:hypothetical protein DRE_03933 [Drechslerella stenobrocha 248]|uniref:Pyroglutamyl-peptidase I n=1 Tax=Drechslerella stenobrocha 248 TaxID=1043628 RepID=W7HS56_9PEZI|nr:hypothetical protein DRE_03933 [Drechslerella stenobrocha 248]
MPPAVIAAHQQEEPNASTSAVAQHPHHRPHRIFKVYVTGFGSFEGITENASFHVAAHLPSTLDKKYTSHASDAIKAQDLHVEITGHPTPVTVAYATVEELVPKLYEELVDVDLFVHIGVAPFDYYQVETRARRRPYGPPEGKPDGRKDVDGKWPVDNSADRAARGKVPDEVSEIVTGLDVAGICETLAGIYRDENAEGNADWEAPRVSDDAGLYLCEFILYNSMAEAVYGAGYKTGQLESKPVSDPEARPPSTSRAVFIHIPSDTEEKSLEKSVESVKRIIGAIAVQRVS